MGDFTAGAGHGSTRRAHTLTSHHKTKNPAGFSISGCAENGLDGGELGPVVADGLNRAAFHGFLALPLFFGRAGLFVKVGIASVVVTGEVVRRGFTAEVAVDALVIDEEFSLHVFRVLVRNVSHKVI